MTMEYETEKAAKVPQVERLNWLCRCCLGDQYLQPFFTPHRNGDSQLLYPEIIHFCFNIQLLPADLDDSSQICKTCIRNVLQSYHFKIKIQNSTNIFQQQHLFAQKPIHKENIVLSNDKIHIVKNEVKLKVPNFHIESDKTMGERVDKLNEKEQTEQQVNIEDKVDDPLYPIEKKRKHSDDSWIQSIRKSSNITSTSCEKAKTETQQNIATSCLDKCYLSIQNKEILLQKMNDLGDYNKQNLFLRNLISLNKKQRIRLTEENRKKNRTIYEYSVVEGDHAIIVCKNAFMELFCISYKRLRKIQKSVSAGDPSIALDKRGLHAKKKTKDETKHSIREHIASFPIEISNDSTYLNSDKKYLPSSLNISKMYRLYKDKYPDTDVKEWLYRDIFLHEFNLDFGIPSGNKCVSPIQYNCNKCSEIFSTSMNLRQHVRNAHPKEKNHECESCGSKFFNKKRLSIHYQKHIGVQNFKCDLCNKSFLRKINMDLHMQSHCDPQYKCMECDNQFIQKITMQGHMKSIHNIHVKMKDIKPFKMYIK